MHVFLKYLNVSLKKSSGSNIIIAFNRVVDTSVFVTIGVMKN